MYTITVVNKRTYKGEYGLYIGRPSVLGNPFPLKIETDRNKICDQYQQWFDKQIKEKNLNVLAALKNLNSIGEKFGHLDLVCFCAPKRCHGETIKKYLEDLQQTEENWNEKVIQYSQNQILQISYA